MAKNTNTLAGIHSVLHLTAAANTPVTSNTALAHLLELPDTEVTRETEKFHVYQDEEERTIVTTKSVGDMECKAVSIGTDTDQIAIEAALHSGVESYYAITHSAKNDYTTGDVDRFKAFVTKFSREAPMDGKVSCSFTLAVTGGLTNAALA